MQLEKNSQKGSWKLVILIVALVLVALLAAGGVVVGLQMSKLNYDKIYEGITIGSVDVGKMSLEEATGAVSDAYMIDGERKITLSCDGVETELSLNEIEAKVNAEKSAENAYAIGREGSSKERLALISDIKKNGTTVDVVLDYNNDVLIAKVHEIANVVDIPERELSVVLEGEELVITRGEKGQRILEDTAKKQISEAILDSSKNTVELTKEEVNPPELTVEYLQNEVCTEPQDASYKIENQKLTIIDEKTGVDIDVAKAKEIIESTPGDVVRIPVILTNPEVTAEKINAELFPDLLATYSSNYSASNVSRSHNVALASQLISNTVLAPGDVFSYNDTVGPRTAARGFREAGVYVGNKVEQGIGGGICQVSSTLFNTVVLSDLKIVYRTNHSLPVSYVPLGRDATVSYGSIDFKFSNSTNAPIKIVASASNGKNVVSIYGTKQHPGRTIEITTECTGTYAPKVKTVEDPELAVGVVEVDEEGSKGSSYVTYKITKENGAVVKSEVLTKSTYSGTDRVERVGTNENIAPDGTPIAVPGDAMVPGQTVTAPEVNAGAPIASAPEVAPEAVPEAADSIG